ncbi:hypothetical protein [Pelagicoccus albus]|uniref:Uncharacterized protein n=1 Tax=Pelagicoccus albus TaxID=415222 RepID=A0A7X1B8V4_9BACT|nr:hypothetical protein [Pelagicoccus albus]MBC2607840.1 hypothetical protein [Pelagicoccus albus]
MPTIIHPRARDGPEKLDTHEKREPAATGMHWAETISHAKLNTQSLH